MLDVIGQARHHAARVGDPANRQVASRGRQGAGNDATHRALVGGVLAILLHRRLRLVRAHDDGGQERQARAAGSDRADHPAAAAAAAGSAAAAAAREDRGAACRRTSRSRRPRTTSRRPPQQLGLDARRRARATMPSVSRRATAAAIWSAATAARRLPGTPNRLKDAILEKLSADAPPRVEEVFAVGARLDRGGRPHQAGQAGRAAPADGCSTRRIEADLSSLSQAERLAAARKCRSRSV